MRTPFTTTSGRLAAALAAGAIALTACGGAEATGPDQPVGAPADGGQGIDVGEPNGADGGAAGGTRPADQEFTPEQRAQMLLGATEEEAMNLALEFGWVVRVGRVDDDGRMLTEDYQIDRITIELDTPSEGGEPVVTNVKIELDGGPETYEA